MARQERAEQTRRALIAAAASEFDQHGYAGTSLARIGAGAGVTMGAMTFHFPVKIAIARTVHEAGAGATRDALRRVHEDAGPGLQAVIDLTHALAGILESDTQVRAAARLAREKPDAVGDWRAEWLPVLKDLLDAAGDHLPDGIEPAEVGPLVEFLVAGAEETSREHHRRTGGAAAGEESGETRELLTGIWELLLVGLAHASAREELRPAGTPTPRR
ncbi:TetR family transcriptional regulator [Streptomyces sp. CT34]|uniref:TetR family transcriptional regulator n=1 Tax=Streptomyces sp. CT34 TaxID=1553907 RepID=UPI00068FF1EA|nr:TetR family transcriptional regulator [Streptomyces sp. CT34]